MKRADTADSFRVDVKRVCVKVRNGTPGDRTVVFSSRMLDLVTETIRQVGDEFVAETVANAAHDDSVTPDVVTHTIRSCLDEDLEDVYMKRLEASYLKAAESGRKKKLKQKH